MVTQAQLNTVYGVSMDSLAGQSQSYTWSTYSGAAMLAAFQTAKALGFNTVRFPLQPLSGSFAWPTPTSPQLANLTDCCNQAHTAGVRVQFVLFKDWDFTAELASFAEVTYSKTWTAAIIGAIQTSNLVFTSSLATSTATIEIYNEIPFSSAITYAGGTTGGGYAGPALPQSIGVVSIAWAQALIPYARTTSGGLVTVSCANLSGVFDEYYDLSAGVAGLSGAQVPDWWEWHCYAGESAPVLSGDMANALAVVTPAALKIGETGTPIFQNGPNAQMQWFQNARYAAQSLGLGEPAPYQLFDNSVGSGYGLYSQTSVANPVIYNLYGPFPPGSGGSQTGIACWFGAPPNRGRIAAI